MLEDLDGEKVTYVYAALTLHAAGNEITEENMKRILEAAGARFDESEIVAVMTLVKALKSTPQMLPSEDSAQLPKEQYIDEKTLKMMSLKEACLGGPVAPSTSTIEPEGLYLYCLGDDVVEASFGNIGIERNTVYTIPHKDISAVVHRCSPEPYKSEDDQRVKEWVMAHQSVVDAAWAKFSTVLPIGFDTIIKSSGAVSAEENLKKWLEENCQKLRENLNRVRGRAEVGVQIFWNAKVMAQSLMETDEEIKKLSQEMKEKPPGLAYFHKQKIEKALRDGLEGKADGYFKDFYSRIRKYADDIRVEKTKRGGGDKQMIMNLSVLIQKDKIRMLGEELAKIKEMEGIDVRFTGPWPPYSFVTQV